VCSISALAYETSNLDEKGFQWRIVAHIFQTKLIHKILIAAPSISSDYLINIPTDAHT